MTIETNQLLRHSPPMLGDNNGSILYEDAQYVVFYTKERTVYIDSARGSQYQPREYVVLEKTGDAVDFSSNQEQVIGEFVKELFRFSRSI